MRETARQRRKRESREATIFWSIVIIGIAFFIGTITVIEYTEWVCESVPNHYSCPGN